jgi:hypothetical protein
MITKKSQKSPNYFHCEKCDYTTTNKFDWKKHISTTKHQNGNFMVTKKTKVLKYICKKCNKNYKFKSGLSRHKKKCKNKGGNTLLNNSAKSRQTTNALNNINNDNLSESIKLMAQTVAKQGNILEKLIDSQNEMIPKLGNNNNNNVSINIFLNQQCTDAMNLTDFVKNIKISLEDLQYTNEHGYVKGISNIFQKNLTDLKATERPIHCSDKKRLQFYVKDEDKWEKDVTHEKMKKGIESIGKQQILQIKEWEKQHPDFLEHEEQYMEWNKMVGNMMGGDTQQRRNKNIENIKKIISNDVAVKDALIKQ